MGEEVRSLFQEIWVKYRVCFYLPHVSHVLCDADLAVSILRNSATRMVKLPAIKWGNFLTFTFFSLPRVCINSHPLRSNLLSYQHSPPPPKKNPVCKFFFNKDDIRSSIAKYPKVSISPHIVKKRLTIFPYPAGRSLTWRGNNLIIPRQEEFG
jgi:hypothetical protein